ncbi:hypothetical protein [Spirosoma flavum]|uniref:Uncharacterized protein n=1 Tax=Spirosoma flavum TaxID=2048557 RepID=A0ABW6ALD1_9BACT
MTNATITQESVSERLVKNTQAFRAAYERLNYKQQQKEQKVFCNQYDIAPVSFRARLSGATRVADTELAFLEKRVNAYFQA